MPLQADAVGVVLYRGRFAEDAGWMEARRMIVKGRVQGVGFRYYVYRQADALGTKGWVRNLPNGDVEVHAEGELDILSEFERRVGRGPSFSFVTEFETSRSVFLGHKTFEIRS